MYRFKPAEQELRPYLLAMPLAGCLAMLVGCESDSDQNAASSSVAIELSMPGGVLRNIDRSVLSVQVSVDDVLQTVSPNSDRSAWISNFSLAEDRPSRLLVEWQYNAMLIARYGEEVGPVAERTTHEVLATEYVTTGNEFDADSDRTSNLDELRNNTNPADPLNIDIVIPRVPAGGGPGINGTTGVVWADNISVDWQGAELSIDNLIATTDVQGDDAQTEFYWQAVHDGTSVYFIVYGENVENHTPWNDSAGMYHDDGVNIYIDGNNSKLESYDGIDDRHIDIPLLTKARVAEDSMGLEPVEDAAGNYDINSDGLLVESQGNQFRVTPAPVSINGKQNPDSRVGHHENSLPTPDSLRFENGVPEQGQHVYEVKLDITELGISIGAPFGLDVQIDNDVDGGKRDLRFSWSRKSQADGPIDVNSNKKPSVFGTAVLQQ